ncbi:MAG: hypothetical protein KDC85_04690 [Saprospiraceae bacterium]|nr:hypothetical protein [Saprospiraceae bacterium]MCB9325105.1 hypothetical protein [Lewinellaceae bacterium]
MKNFKPIFLFLLAVLLSLPLMGQKKCRVMSPNLKGTYEGKCERGLAHGKGLAVGTDTYKGSFKKGYPHGQGTCYYADGSFYAGEWKKGMKDGEGKLAFQLDGRDTVTVGKWKDDVYVGPITAAPYQINMSRGVDRYSFRRINDGDRVMIHFMQNGMTNTSIEDFRIFSDKGTQVFLMNAYGYENIDEFPFTCKINYITSNKLHTAKNEVIFVFTINEPGDWEVTIHN